MSEEEIWIGSDGGLKTQDGTFGWVIATATDIMWENNGYTPGNRTLTETLRTESIGLLSAIIFIHLYTKYHDISINSNKIIHSCDNMGVVQRIKWMEIRSIKTANESLTPDYDVQAQIEATYKSMGITFQTNHVKGHQDREDTTAKNHQQRLRQGQDGKKELSWEATLNIAADELATNARKKITPKMRREQILYPACKAHLIINNENITRNIKQIIRQEWNLIDLRKDYRTRFGWTRTTFDSIDWNASGWKEKKNDYYKKRFTCRYINKRLPLNGEKYTGSNNKTCPCCKQTEDAKHFLTCNRNIEKWESLVENLQETYKKEQIDPCIRILINRALLNLPMDKTEEDHKDINWTPYQRLIQQQTTIGWEQIKYGRYGKEWSKIQRRYSEKMHQNREDDPYWLGRIIQKTRNFAQTRWKHRNATAHPKEGPQETTRAYLLQQIKQLYSRSDDMPQQDKFIFNKPLEDWKTIPTIEIRRWIKGNKTFIPQCIKIYKAQQRGQYRDIRTYLKKTNTPNQTTNQEGKTTKESNTGGETQDRENTMRKKHKKQKKKHKRTGHKKLASKMGQEHHQERQQQKTKPEKRHERTK